MNSDKPRSRRFPYGLMPTIIACPILSSYLRHHEVGTLLSRASIVGLVAAGLTLLAMGITRVIDSDEPLSFERARFAPIIMAIAMALASMGSDWISIHWG